MHDIRILACKQEVRTKSLIFVFVSLDAQVSSEWSCMLEYKEWLILDVGVRNWSVPIASASACVVKSGSFLFLLLKPNLKMSSRFFSPLSCNTPSDSFSL